MQTAAELQQVLYAYIPLSRVMGVKVVEAEISHTLLSAPLSPNINHQGTAFGGSINALAILSAYALLYLRLGGRQPPCHVIIQQGSMQYARPVRGDMLAECRFDDTVRWSRFLRTLQRHGRARLRLESVVLHEGQACASFAGDFIALCG